MLSGLPNLNTILGYRCDSAVHVFRRKYALNETEAVQVWQDMLIWLYLGSCHNLDKDTSKPEKLVIFPQLLAIDEMWHAFILCTREYADFCHWAFGKFIHHVPNTAHENILPQSEFDNMVAYVHRILGGNIAMRWFVEIPLLVEEIEEYPTFKRRTEAT